MPIYALGSNLYYQMVSFEFALNLLNHFVLLYVVHLQRYFGNIPQHFECILCYGFLENVSYET